MAKRSYGSGRLYAKKDRHGREVWLASWWAGGTRVHRKIGLKRGPGEREGLTQVQAERELRRRIESDLVVARRSERWTVGDAGAATSTTLST